VCDDEMLFEFKSLSTSISIEVARCVAGNGWGGREMAQSLVPTPP